MASSKLASEFRIHWAELRFPPLNLWVMASLSASVSSHNHTHRKTTPAPNKSSKTLHKLHQRLETLLAVRGGKI